MPSKKKRYTRASDPLLKGVKKYNPLGTKKQADHAERIRDLKNRIHELEQNEIAFFSAKANWRNREDEYMRRLVACAPTKIQREALKVICDLGVSDAVRLGIHDAIVVLSGWQDDLVDREPKVDSGKATAPQQLELIPEVR